MRICLTLPFQDSTSTASFALPYGMAIIAPIIRKQYADADVYFSNVENDILSADIVYCSGLSESWDLVNDLGRKVTGQGKRFIVGGQHVTALPKTLRVGETFLGPLESIDKEWTNPLPDWSIFSNAQKENAQYVVMTSRGCPFKCHFCSSSAFWGGYTAIPIDRVIKEITQLANIGAERIIIFDDLFTANENRLHKIVQRVVEEGLNKIEYSCLVRADTVSSSTLDLLRTMNVTAAAFGAESGSNAMLQAMNKKTTQEMNQQCINVLLAHGYMPVCSLIIGFPGENSATLNETLSFIENNKDACMMEVVPAQPFPGTWLWDYFMNKFSPSLDEFPWRSLGLRVNEVDWDTYHVLSDSCTKEDLQAFFTQVAKMKKSLSKAKKGGRFAKITKKIQQSIANVFR